MTEKYQEKVIVSLTTISSRIHRLHKVIESLLSQTYQNYIIHLYISHEPYLLDDGISSIPNNLHALEKSFDKFIIKFTNNTGPYRKLLPTLTEFWGCKQILVSVDDDVIYPPHFLATLVAAERLHHCPVAFRGRRATIDSGNFNKYSHWLKNNQAGKTMLNVPTGRDGVLYRPSYFLKNVLDIDSALHLAKTADDLWFKWNTTLNGYPSCLLSDSLSHSFDSVDGSFNSGPNLFESFNEHGKNDAVVCALEKHFLQNLGHNFIKVIHPN